MQITIVPQSLPYLRPIFVETQHLSHYKYFPFVIVVSILLIGAPMAIALVTRKHEVLLVAGLVAIPVGLMLGYFASASLTVRVDADGVHIRFFPIHKISIPHRRIVNIEVQTYEPISEFGGWGMKGPPGRWGWCMTVSGNRGVRLELENRHRLLIGSQRAEELAEAIRSASA